MRRLPSSKPPSKPGKIPENSYEAKKTVNEMVRRVPRQSLVKASTYPKNAPQAYPKMSDEPKPRSGMCLVHIGSETNGPAASAQGRLTIFLESDGMTVSFFMQPKDMIDFAKQLDSILKNQRIGEL